MGPLPGINKTSLPTYPTSYVIRQHSSCCRRVFPPPSGHLSRILFIFAATMWSTSLSFYSIRMGGGGFVNPIRFDGHGFSYFLNPRRSDPSIITTALTKAVHIGRGRQCSGRKQQLTVGQQLFPHLRRCFLNQHFLRLSCVELKKYASKLRGFL